MQDIEVRIKILTCFRDAVREWSSGKQTDELRSYINRNLMAVQTAVKDVGTFQTITVGPPPAIGGGLVLADQNPFLHIFRSLYGRSVIPMVVDMIEQAIGVYEYMRDNSGLVRIQSPEAIDIETAIERALRPHFRKSPPKSETAVQDSIETILNALGIDFRREKDTAPIGRRAFRPDFTVDNLSLAIEVKLATEKHSPSAIQEEIAADITAYKTRWKHLLFVIYDTGVIADPYQMRRENMRLFGVSVVIIKH